MTADDVSQIPQCDLYPFQKQTNKKEIMICGINNGGDAMPGRLSFGIAVIMLISATSMNRRQAYGEGWLNGECYIVKGGTYIGSAILVIVTIASCIAASLLSTVNTKQVDENRKVHAQMNGVTL